MTAVAVQAAADPPKLLLDTNVFRALADGELRPYEERLLRVAQQRNRPLLWTCPTVCQEILCHIRPEEADRFDHFREALLWTERLCGDDGMAEDHPWIRTCALFTERGPVEDKARAAVNQIRRSILQAQTFADVTPQMLESLRRFRAAFEEKITEWKQDQAQVFEVMRKLTAAPEKYLLAVLTETILETARRIEERRVSSWGPMVSREDQKIAMREVIAFRLSQYRKARLHPDYSVKTNDHNDGWLCPYPGAGFVLVTGDEKLKRALLMAECENPRVMELPEAVDAAEAALGG